MNSLREKIKVLIVDDSPFSRKLIADALDPECFQVVGYADGFRSALESYRELSPDVITMDVIMPEIDGIEATRRIMQEEPGAKIVIISSLQDEELVENAKAHGAVGYIQKPFDAQELWATLKRASASSTQTNGFTLCYASVFKDAFANLMKRFGVFGAINEEECDLRNEINGLVALVGISGNHSGRMTLDLTCDTARRLASRLLKQEPQNDEQIAAVLSELANLIAGNAASILNKSSQDIHLRIAPPSLYTGEKFAVTTPGIDCRNFLMETPCGNVRLSIGFRVAEEK